MEVDVEEGIFNWSVAKLKIIYLLGLA